MPHIWSTKQTMQTSLTNGEITIVIFLKTKMATKKLENLICKVWYTWPSGRETNCIARGVFATATYRRGPEIYFGVPFARER